MFFLAVEYLIRGLRIASYRLQYSLFVHLANSEKSKIDLLLYKLMFIVRTVRRLLATKKDLDEQLARLAKDYQHAVKQPLTDESSDKMFKLLDEIEQLRRLKQK
jgi:uncharacterized protein YciU (UPF0263 family)